MLCMAVDVYLSAGTREVKGSGRVKVEETPSLVRKFLEMAAVEAVSYAAKFLQEGKYSCGIYLEIVEVSPALEVFVEWHHRLFDPKRHHLLDWEEVGNGGK